MRKGNNNSSVGPLLAAMCAVATLPGCAGYNHVLFMTKSNAGLDIDSTPPTAEINIARKEVVVAPNFAQGQTPPVVASFGSRLGNSAGAPGRFFFGADQTFGGGDAALTLAECYNVEDAECGVHEAYIGLAQLPSDSVSPNRFKDFFFSMQRPEQVKPFVFGTDSQLGLKVAWSGTGGPYPDTLKLGYNRKEFALAPVTITPNNYTNALKDSRNQTPYRIDIPSFLATVNANAEAGMTREQETAVGTQHVKWMQYFATGKAATALARHQDVRRAMILRMDPSQSSAFTEQEIQRAKASNELRAARIDVIVKQVSSADGMLDAQALQKIAGPVFNMSNWADAYRTDNGDALRKDLRERYPEFVDPLFDQLAAPQQDKESVE